MNENNDQKKLETTNSSKSKKSNLLLILIIIILVIGLIAVLYYFLVMPKNRGTQTESDNIQTYENSRFGFSFGYPSNWQLGEAPTNNDGRTITSSSGEVTCRAFGFYNIQTNGSKEPQTLDQYIGWLIDTGTQANPSGSFSVIENSKTKLGEKDAVRLVLSESGSVSDSIYTLDTEKGVGFSCDYNNLDQRLTFEDIFNLMKESFKIK